MLTDDDIRVSVGETIVITDDDDETGSARCGPMSMVENFDCMHGPRIMAECTVLKSSSSPNEPESVRTYFASLWTVLCNSFHLSPSASFAHSELDERDPDRTIEAAIYLKEGRDNVKFDLHPRGDRVSISRYHLASHVYFQVVDFVLAVALLTLALWETPACQPFIVNIYGVPEANVVSLSNISRVNMSTTYPVDALQDCSSSTRLVSVCDLAILLCIVLQCLVKFKCLGSKWLVIQRRSQLKLVILVALIFNALGTIAWPVSAVSRHWMATAIRCIRGLRPICLIDNAFCSGVRRFLRQILQSIAPVLDMLALVFVVTVIYSVFSFYLFGLVDKVRFGTLFRAFVSHFVLLTTANFPDVMMSVYAHSRTSALFFVSYLLINLYLLMNLMLAVVFDAFTHIEKAKFRQMYLHKRRAVQLAYTLLESTRTDNRSGVQFDRFVDVLRTYCPREDALTSYVKFKYMDRISKRGLLALDDMQQIYAACSMHWHIRKPCNDHPSQIWFNSGSSSVGITCKQAVILIRRAVNTRQFEWIVTGFIALNAATLLIQTASMSGASEQEIYSTGAHWVSYVFIAFYAVETMMKLIAFGPATYFASHFHVFDFVVTVSGILSVVLQTLNIHLFYIVILRPVRLLGLFKTKQRFRDVFSTAIILLPRCLSAVVLVVLIYYLFGVIGIELFGGLPLKNCCHNSSVATFFDATHSLDDGLHYYLNNFDSLPVAYVTLFELTVVNNWFVLMDGYAIVSNSEWSRLYFMFFYLLTMIVVAIVVASVLEAFLFKIQFTENIAKHQEMDKTSAVVSLSEDEIKFIQQFASARKWPLSGVARFRHLNYLSDGESVQLDESEVRDDTSERSAIIHFEGSRPLTKEVLQTLMYADEMEGWIAEAKRDESIRAYATAKTAAALAKAEAT